MIHNTQSAQISQKQDGRNIYAIMKTMPRPGYHHNGYVATHELGRMIAYILRPSCFCEIWALCVLWITYDHLYYAPCLACWALFGSLVPAMSNRTSCAQVHELPQSHCGDNREGTLFSWLHIHYTHLAFVRFEHSVCVVNHLWLIILCSLLSLLNTLMFNGTNNV